MIRKTLIALTAATALGAGAFTPLTALAKPGGGFGGAHGVQGSHSTLGVSRAQGLHIPDRNHGSGPGLHLPNRDGGLHADPRHLQLPKGGKGLHVDPRHVKLPKGERRWGPYSYDYGGPYYAAARCQWRRQVNWDTGDFIKVWVCP